MTNCYFSSVTARCTHRHTHSMTPFHSFALSLVLTLKMRFSYLCYAKWFNDDTFFDDFEKFNYLCGSLLCVYGILQFVMKLYDVRTRMHARTYTYSNISTARLCRFDCSVFTVCLMYCQQHIKLSKNDLIQTHFHPFVCFRSRFFCCRYCSYTSHDVMMLKLSVNTTWRCKYPLKILSKYL